MFATLQIWRVYAFIPNALIPNCRSPDYIQEIDVWENDVDLLLKDVSRSQTNVTIIREIDVWDHDVSGLLYSGLVHSGNRRSVNLGIV